MLGQASRESGRKPSGKRSELSVKKSAGPKLKEALPYGHQKLTYHRGLVALLEAHELLANVKVHGWTQAQVLNEIFEKLEFAGQFLIDISPNDVTSDVRQAVKRWEESNA